MSRAPSAPPLLDGYEYLGLLGSGGFADVFQYLQMRPRREVAVKVLLRGLGPHAQQQFEDEANVMALLSNHPSIVSIFASGVAPDGRPFLVMENCQPRSLGARIRQRPLSVGRALEVGIQVAGAVETAHRLGILHRDIKPANILFTDFGRPALTDFGISAATGGQVAAAFSVAWAPPEQIDNQAMGPTGDVYSLAATVWATIVGRSPFDVPGDNNSFAITSRAKTLPVPPTGRAGVPDSLERILRTAMAKRPEQRYGSALEFARALQGVQAELHESVTTIDVREERGDEEFIDQTETGTRVTGFAMIDPDLPAEKTSSGWFDLSDTAGTRPTDGTDTGSTAPTIQVTPALIQHGQGSKPAHEPLEFTGPAVPQVPFDDTYVVGSPQAQALVQPEQRKRSRLPMALALATLLVVAGLIGAWVVSGIGRGTVVPTTSQSAQPKSPLGAVPQPTGLAGVVSGKTVVFTWTNPSPQPGDRYLYELEKVGAEPTQEYTTEAGVTVPVQPDRTCLKVALVRADGRFSDMTKGCTP